MIEKCPDCGSTDLIVADQGNGYSKAQITSLRGTTIKHIICPDCGLIIESRINNIKLAKKSGRRLSENK